MEYIKSRRITLSIMMRKDDEEAANGDEMGLDSGFAAKLLLQSLITKGAWPDLH